MDQVNETESAENTVRRFARQLIAAENLIDTELIRLAIDDLFPARWWQFGRRRWRAGVFIAREIHRRKLQEIRDVMHGV